MSAQIAADLRAAAEVLRRDGWTQGAYFSVARHCHCALGAIATAVTGEQFVSPDEDAFVHRPEARRYWAGVARLNRAIGLDGDLETVYEWNDEPGRTADEVIAALEAAAVAAEADL